MIKDYIGEISRAEDLLPLDPAIKTINFVSNFTSFIISHISECPNAEISKLGALFIELATNQMIGFVISSKHGFSFVSDRTDAVVIVHPNFFELMDSHHFVGGMVNIASQVKDFYNNKIDSNSKMRGDAAEAEVINLIKEDAYDLMLSEQQDEIIDKYPLGLNSLETDIWYDSKDFKPGNKCYLYKKTPSYKLN